MSARVGVKHDYFKVLGPAVHKLPDGERRPSLVCCLRKAFVAPFAILLNLVSETSIFTLPGVKLQKDPGHRSTSSSISGERFGACTLQHRLKPSSFIVPHASNIVTRLIMFTAAKLRCLLAVTSQVTVFNTDGGTL